MCATFNHVLSRGLAIENVFMIAKLEFMIIMFRQRFYDQGDEIEMKLEGRN